MPNPPLYKSSFSLTWNARKLEIETQRRQLEAHSRKLLLDYRSIEKDLDKDILAYSKAWHKKFSTDLFARLPPEVRAMIWDYLLSPHWLVQLTRDESSGWFKKKTSFPRDAPYFQVDYVGEQMSRELYERVLKTSSFEVKSLTMASWLLRTDIFDCGLLPRDTIRSLNVHIFPDDQKPDAVTKFPTLEPKQVASLEKLVSIRRKEGFRLCFLLVAQSIEDIRSLLLSLATFVYRFKNEGFDVKVVKWSRPHPKLCPLQEKKVKDRRDLTQMFDHADPADCRAVIEGFQKLVSSDLRQSTYHGLIRVLIRCQSEIGVKSSAIQLLGHP